MTTGIKWAAIKKWSKRIAIGFGVLYLLGVVLWSWPRHPDCPVEEHMFQGQEFDVEFCHNYTSSRQYIGIGVYSKEGRLLAWRAATFANESRLNYMAIEDTMIRYSDNPMDQINPPADCILNMPPTWVDWLETRLPGGIPGVNHCSKASDEVVSRAQDQWERRMEEKEKKRRDSVSRPAPPAAPPTSR
jgi:hypothetical protein